MHNYLNDMMSTFRGMRAAYYNWSAHVHGKWEDQDAEKINNEAITKKNRKRKHNEKAMEREGKPGKKRRGGKRN